MGQRISFTMERHTEQPKHSTRFNFETFVDDPKTEAPEVQAKPEKFRPSFYIPKPFAATAKRIRVTIEEIS